MSLRNAALFALSMAGFAAAAPAAERVVLDAFERESPEPWTWRGVGKLTIAEGRAPGSKGERVLRLETTARLPKHRIWWGELRLTPPPVTDWTPYHCLTVWVRALGGRRIHSLAVYAENQGDRLESHHVILPHKRWTRVVFPITHLRRESVSVVFFSHTAAGALPGEALDEVYEFDDLALEGGRPAPMAGWQVAEGHVAFAHCGYRPDEPKRILFPPATKGPAVVRTAEGEPVRRVPLTADAFGNRVADLSDLRDEGTYVVEAGGVATEPFPVRKDAWLAPARAVVRFLYLMRCGCEVKDERIGHGPCHLDNCRPRLPDGLDETRWPLARRHLELLGDWFDLTGGWHDAGIIDQYTGNTGLMTYALAALAEARPEVAAQARDEAVWGGRWLVKATLPTGAMVMQSSGQVRWTDNQPRTADDRCADVEGCWANHAMKAVAGMARLARALGDREPRLRADLLAAIRRAIRHNRADVFPGYTESRFLFSSWGALAGLEAHAATGDDESLGFALGNLARMLECQDEAAGFFYAGTDRKHPFRYAQGQCIGVLALCRACELHPKHALAPTWRQAVARWCDGYAPPMTRLAGGYGIIAFALYDDDEEEAYNGKESWWAKPYDPKTFAPWPPASRELRHAGRRVRVFGAHRGGNNRLLCGSAAALSAAARLLERPALAALAADQLQWIAGRNPLSQCLISHVGHRSPLAYQTVIGDVHGAMYQGIGSRNGDAPFLSPNCHHTQKEIWGVCGGYYLLAAAQRPPPAALSLRQDPAGKAVRAWPWEGSDARRRYQIVSMSVCWMPPSEVTRASMARDDSLSGDVRYHRIACVSASMAAIRDQSLLGSYPTSPHEPGGTPPP